MKNNKNLILGVIIGTAVGITLKDQPTWMVIVIAIIATIFAIIGLGMIKKSGHTK